METEQTQSSRQIESHQCVVTASNLDTESSSGSISDADAPFENDEIRAAQVNDDGISIVIKYCTEKKPPDKSELRALPEEAKELLLQWDSLIVRDGILYRRFQHPDGATKFFQLVLPGKLRREYIERLHTDLGHFGQSKTCEAVSRRIYFPGWRPYTKLIVKNCTVCNKSQRGRQMPKHTPLRPMREFRPMAVLHADLVGPIPAGSNAKGQHGFQYILSVIDSATRYLWLVPIKNKTAEAVATALYEEVIVRTSVPSAILTDLGGEFTAEIMDRLYERLGITRLKTSGYRPQTDAKCERAHYSVHNMITKFIEQDYKHWPSYLSAVSLAYNSTVHTSTNYAPHELFYSFPPSCPLDVIVEAEREEEPVNSADQYALEATERLREAFRFMREYTGRQTERMKSNYDASIKPKQFEVGSFVLLFSPKKRRNVYTRWNIAWTGPFRVMKQVNPSNYIIQRSCRSNSFIVHGDRLREYHGEIVESTWPSLFREQADQGGSMSATSSPQPCADHVNERRGKHPSEPPSCPSVGNQPSRGDQQSAVSDVATSTPATPASGRDTAGGPDINYANESSPMTTATSSSTDARSPSSQSAEPAASPRRSGRRRRKPARYVQRTVASPAAALDGESLTPSLLCNRVKVSTENRTFQYCTSVESTEYCRQSVLSENTVDISISEMSDRPKRTCRREPPVEWRGSSSSRPFFEPRQCALCPATNVRRTVYKSRSGLNKHAVKHHGKWYRPRDNSYVDIPPENLEAARDRIRRGQSHQPVAQQTASSQPSVVREFGVQNVPSALPTGIGRGRCLMRVQAQRDPPGSMSTFSGDRPASISTATATTGPSSYDMSRSCPILEFHPEIDNTVIGTDRNLDTEPSRNLPVAAGLDLAAVNGQSTAGSVAEGGGASPAPVPDSIDLDVPSDVTPVVEFIALADEDTVIDAVRSTIHVDESRDSVLSSASSDSFDIIPEFDDVDRSPVRVQLTSRPVTPAESDFVVFPAASITLGGELSHRPPLTLEDLLSVIRITTPLEVSRVAQSLYENYTYPRGPEFLAAQLTAMHGTSVDVASRLLDQIAHLRATEVDDKTQMDTLVNILVSMTSRKAIP